ncbi:Aminotransferase class I and II [seawater metagenome]|uniref:Aminotransferase class I and II n=1 Tax=seawater metagenome TaxID=1561972 RepID=A0A5E8CJM2_9ZZZZ
MINLGSSQLKYPNDSIINIQPNQKILEYCSFEDSFIYKKNMLNALNTYFKCELHTSELVITGNIGLVLRMIISSFLPPNSLLLVENPTYYNVVTLIKSIKHELNYEYLNIQKDGIDIDQLETKLLNNKNKQIYLLITPYYHNPTGYTYCDHKLDKINELSKIYPNLTIISDEIYIYHHDVKPLYIKYNNKNIISLLGFSKILFGGIRHSCIISHKDNIISNEVENSNGIISSHDHYFINEYITNFNINDELVYRKKIFDITRTICIQKIKNHLNEYLTIINEEKGYWIWCKLKNHNINTTKLVDYLQQKNIFILNGDLFFFEKQKDKYIRFSSYNDLNIFEYAIKIIKKTLDKMN